MLLSKGLEYSRDQIKNLRSEPTNPQKPSNLEEPIQIVFFFFYQKIRVGPTTTGRRVGVFGVGYWLCRVLEKLQRNGKRMPTFIVSYGDEKETFA